MLNTMNSAFYRPVSHRKNSAGMYRSDSYNPRTFNNLTIFGSERAKNPGSNALQQAIGVFAMENNKLKDLEEERFYNLYVERRELKIEEKKWKHLNPVNITEGVELERKLARIRKRLAAIDMDLRATSGSNEGEKNNKFPKGSEDWRSENARNAAKARYEQENGYGSQRRFLMEQLATGNYLTKAECIRECKNKYSQKIAVEPETARKWLSRVENPGRKPRNKKPASA